MQENKSQADRLEVRILFIYVYKSLLKFILSKRILPAFFFIAKSHQSQVFDALQYCIIAKPGTQKQPQWKVNKKEQKKKIVLK